MMITTIFVSIAMLCAILMKDKARGIGMAILFWLFLSLIYDGLVLFFMFQLADYPIENAMVILSAANPVDLARIMVILQVDVAALMGYTGAIFKKLFGNSFGMLLSFFIMALWVAGPFILSLKKFNKKDL
jgi:Cu-processing system permease protein